MAMLLNRTMAAAPMFRRTALNVTQRRGFAGHGAPPAAAGDFVPAAPTAPSNVAFFGESLGGWVDATFGNSTFQSFKTRALSPWAVTFPITLWMVSKMTVTRK
jgi:hypothetical protein